MGHVVTNVSNIRSRITKKNLQLFNVELEMQPNNKEVYDIKGLLYTSVSVEPPHPKREIPQCTNCQSFVHTKGYCFRDPKCVKCAETHATKDCPRKTRDESVKCTNCKLNHPANFRGCIYHKNMQKKVHPPLRQQRPPGFVPDANRTSGVSYAQITNGNIPQTQPDMTEKNSTNTSENQQQSYNSLEAKLDKMLDKMDKMLEIILTMLTKSNNAATN